MSDKIYKKRLNQKNKFIKKFGDDTKVDYPVYIQKTIVSVMHLVCMTFFKRRRKSGEF